MARGGRGRRGGRGEGCLGAGAKGGSGEAAAGVLTIDQRVQNVLAVLLDQVVDVPEDTAATGLSRSVSCHVLRSRIRAGGLLTTWLQRLFDPHSGRRGAQACRINLPRADEDSGCRPTEKFVMRASEKPWCDGGAGTADKGSCGWGEDGECSGRVDSTTLRRGHPELIFQGRRASPDTALLQRRRQLRVSQSTKHCPYSTLTSHRSGRQALSLFLHPPRGHSTGAGGASPCPLCVCARNARALCSRWPR